MSVTVNPVASPGFRPTAEMVNSQDPRVRAAQVANLRFLLDYALFILDQVVTAGTLLTVGDAIVTETAYGLAPSDGTLDTAARANHTHGSPSLGSSAPVAVGSAAVVGAASVPSREDHVHRGLSALVTALGTVYGALTYTEEIPTGVVNGVNDTFTLSVAPKILQLDQEGVVLRPGGNDFTLTGSTIVYVAGKIPPTGMQHYARMWS